MSVIISDTEYKQYRVFQDNYIFNQKIESAKEQKSLMYDIDEPVRKIVGMLALLHCKPLFSCCGFNYPNQPMHKTHKYGCVYIQVEINDNSSGFVKAMIDQEIFVSPGTETDRWVVGAVPPANKIYFQYDFVAMWAKENGGKQHPWGNPGCIHYPEHGIFAISALEYILIQLEDLFVDEIILEDGNIDYKDRHEKWQYPILAPWTIKKEDILNDVHNC